MGWQPALRVAEEDTMQAMRARPWRCVAQLGLVMGACVVVPARAQLCDPVETGRLLSGSGAVDGFGESLSISGERAVIGAPYSGRNGEESGAAYIFTRSGGVWTQQSELLPDDGSEGDHFGFSVSIGGDLVIIGAPNKQMNGDDSGAAYVFEWNGSEWAFQERLTQLDGGRSFGLQVAVDGETAMVSSDLALLGSAYVFTRSGGVWYQQARLQASDVDLLDRFGDSVAIEGDTAVVGAILEGDGSFNPGAAYVFTRSGGMWTEQAKLRASDPANNDLFGNSVAISGDTVIVGANGDDENGLNAGAVYVFARVGDSWTEQAKLMTSDGEDGDRLGVHASIEGNTVICGVYFDDEKGEDSGSAYVFTRHAGTWGERAKFAPSGGAAGDWFGWNVSLSQGTAAIAALRPNGDGPSSAYMFDLRCADCRIDINNDGSVDTRDFLAFLNAWSSGDPLADWNSDGVINSLDFIAYLNDWTTGC